MKYLIYSLYILLALVVNVGVLPEFLSPTWLPSILLVSVVVVAASFDALSDIFYLALLSGLWWDFYTGAPIGTFLLGFTLVVLAVRALGNLFFSSQHKLRTLPVFFIAAVVVLQMWLLFFSWLSQVLEFSRVSTHPWLGFWENVGGVIAGLLVLYPLYVVLQFLEGWVNRLQRPRHTA